LTDPGNGVIGHLNAFSRRARSVRSNARRGEPKGNDDNLVEHARDPWNPADPGDRFQAKPRPNVPEEEKPTPAQRRAQRQNIKKAQAARRTA
jgi:hypothetical protein